MPRKPNYVQLRMQRSKLVFLAFLLLGITATYEAFACTIASDYPVLKFNSIEVWIESDFHTEYSQDTPVNDSSLTFSRMRNFFMQHAETWNVETSTAAITYKGAANFDGGYTAFCNAVPGASNKLVVYVEHRDSSAGGATASFEYLEECTNNHYARLTIYGSKSGTNLDWRLGSQAQSGNGSELATTVIHEMGHMVGLGHAHLDSPQECESVMAYHNSTYCTGEVDGGRHPLTWDKWCVKISNKGKRLKFRYSSWNNSGSLIQSGITLNDTHYSYSRMSGHLRWTDWPTWKSYSLLGYHRQHDSSVQTNGILNFQVPGDSIPSNYELKYLDETPTLATVEELPNTVAPMMVYFVDDENDSNPSITYNPPVVQRVIANPDFPSSPLSNDLSMKTPNNVSLRSHVSISSAYDPVSNQTLLVRADTRSLDGDDSSGNIYIYPGFVTNYTNKVDYGIHFNPAVPSFWSNEFSYLSRTDLIPAIACGESSWDYYNCAIAWVDKGTYDGSILVSRFRMLPNDQIALHPNGATVLNNGNYDGPSFASPALAFFSDKFWAAYKRRSNTVIVHRSLGYGNFYYNTQFSTDRMIGGPSFGYENNSESAVFFNTTY